MTIRIEQIDAGIVTLLTRVNADGFAWAHMGQLKRNAVQKVHLSALRADDGFDEILATTSRHPCVPTHRDGDSEKLWAQNEAIERGLEI